MKEIHSLSIVEDGALFNCEGLTQLNRDVVLEKIGRFAFSGTGLVSLSFQGNSIGDYAFYNVTALTYAKIIHTAAVGKPTGEMNLSVLRAQAIIDKLVERGLNRDLFTFKGYGGTAPIGDNSTEEGRAKNRRVEIVVKPKTTYIQRY